MSCHRDVPKVSVFVFVYYGLEGLNYIDKIKEKYPVEYKTRYSSTKKFLNYYSKAFDLINTDYIKFQNDMRKTVDFAFDLHENNSFLDVDKYYKFMTYSAVIDLLERFSSQIHVSIKKSLDVAELAYKREYQRRITQVYRANEDNKLITKVEFLAWKENARKQLKLYRENKITKEEFCEWIEKNK